MHRKTLREMMECYASTDLMKRLKRDQGRENGWTSPLQKKLLKGERRFEETLRVVVEGALNDTSKPILLRLGIGENTLPFSLAYRPLTTEEGLLVLRTLCYLEDKGTETASDQLYSINRAIRSVFFHQVEEAGITTLQNYFGTTMLGWMTEVHDSPRHIARALKNASEADVAETGKVYRYDLSPTLFILTCGEAF